MLSNCQYNLSSTELLNEFWNSALQGSLYTDSWWVSASELQAYFVSGDRVRNASSNYTIRHISVTGLRAQY